MITDILQDTQMNENSKFQPRITHPIDSALLYQNIIVMDQSLPTKWKKKQDHLCNSNINLEEINYAVSHLKFLAKSEKYGKSNIIHNWLKL